MIVPPNMTTATMKLGEGEELEFIQSDTSKKFPHFVISDGERTERFWIADEGIDKLVAALAPIGQPPTESGG